MVRTLAFCRVPGKLRDDLMETWTAARASEGHGMLQKTAKELEPKIVTFLRDRLESMRLRHAAGFVRRRQLAEGGFALDGREARGI